jgi:hypothetical protein
LVGGPPAETTRITSIEMDFDGGERAKATLTWKSDK